MSALIWLERPRLAWLGELVSEQQAEKLGGDAAVAGCTYYGVPPGTPASDLCASIGGEIGGFVYRTLDGLTASTDVGTPYDIAVQDQARHAAWAAAVELRRLLNYTVKQLALEGNVSTDAAAKLLGKYVAVGRMSSAQSVCPLVGDGCTYLIDHCTSYTTYPGAYQNKPCCEDWWGSALGTTTEPYVAMVPCNHAIIGNDGTGHMALNVGAYQAGMAAYGQYAKDLLNYAMPNALADIALGAGRPPIIIVPPIILEPMGSGKVASSSSRAWPILLTIGAVAALVWWAMRPLAR